MELKRGVQLTALSPQILLGVMAANEEYAKHKTELVITSCTDGKHSNNSRHYRGDAVDLRTRNLLEPDATGPKIVEALKRKLGRDFDILFEGDHIHMEYDPKRPEE